MRKISITFFCLWVLNSLHAQTDLSIWDETVKLSTPEYIMYYPKEWKRNDQIDLSSKDQQFELFGAGIPKFFNRLPLTAFCSIKRVNTENPQQCEDFILTELSSIPDRVAEPGMLFKFDSIQITSGETGKTIATHYYRRTKEFNFSKFTMMVLNKKRKAFYVITLLFQYKDKSYQIEEELKLKGYAFNTFKRLELR